MWDVVYEVCQYVAHGCPEGSLHIHQKVNPLSEPGRCREFHTSSHTLWRSTLGDLEASLSQTAISTAAQTGRWCSEWQFLDKGDYDKWVCIL